MSAQVVRAIGDEEQGKYMPTCELLLSDNQKRGIRLMVARYVLACSCDHQEPPKYPLLVQAEGDGPFSAYYPSLSVKVGKAED